MRVEIYERPFEPFQVLAQYQESMSSLRGKFGACASFIGTMRDFNEGDTVRGMRLEHYPGMTEKHLESIAQEAVHRVGELHPNDPIVLVAAWSAHRAAAFDACRFMMEDLKSKAPFWKQETLADQQRRWVEKNTSG